MARLKLPHSQSCRLLVILTCALLFCVQPAQAQETPSSGITLRLTDEEKAWLADHPVVKAPSTINFNIQPIYSHDEQGRYTGLGVDIAKIVAKRLGIKIDWVLFNDQVDSIDALNNGTIDFISFMGEDMPGEGTTFTLSSFFQQFPSTFIVPKDTDGQVTVETLRGKRLACVKHWPEIGYIPQYHPEIEVVEVNSALEGLQKVAFGEVDAAVCILPVAAYEIQAGGITTLKIGGKLDKVFRQGFGIRSDWPIFVGLVNKALASMSEQEKTNLYNKWVPVIVSDGIDYERILRWVIPITLIVFVVFSGIVYWNRKLAQAHLAEKRAREEARRQAEEAMQAKQKMERAVEEEQELRKKQVRFVDMISHEYRTPVAVLQTNLDIMQIKDGSIPTAMGTNYSNMQHAITRLTELLDAGLSNGQMTSGDLKANYEWFSLLNCLDEATNHVCSLWPDRSLSYEANSADPVDIYGDQQLVKTVLLNLIENGLKYSETDAPVKVSLERNNSQAVITVLDKGIGIPEADQEKVFEKYYRADHGSKVSGTGVGLFLVKKAIELHNGTIEIDSVRGRGTTVTVSLPLDKLDGQELTD